MGSVHSKEASKLKAPYVTAKHGLIGLAKVLAKEGAEHNVTRQRRLPRLRAHPARRQADSRAGQGARHHRGGGDQDVMLKDTVDGEFTTTDEVADAVLFFAGATSNALTGQSLVVSHGWFMQ